MKGDMVSNSNELDLPARKGGLILASRDSDQSLKVLSLSDKQLSTIVDAGSKALPDVINTVRELINIARIREQGITDVRVIEAETAKAVAIAKIEIEQLRMVGENIKTKGAVVSDILKSVTEMLRSIPDIDVNSRAILISSLASILETAVK